jgi:IstB-like ATP binding protein
MDHDHLTAMLNRLKLTAIRDQLDSLVDEAARRELTVREALSLFCEREIARKDERRIEMSVGLARFPFVRDLEGFDFAAQPSIDKKQIRELAAGRFIANAEAARRIWPWQSGARQSWPAIRCCSCRRRPWSLSLPRRTATAGSRTASPISANPSS